MKKFDIEKLLMALSGIEVFKNDMLPPRTMYVSEDIFELLKSDSVIKDSSDERPATEEEINTHVRIVVLDGGKVAIEVGFGYSLLTD